MNSEQQSVSAPRRNRLAGEKSPYLLQHQHNPVDWYPWGEEAFRKARHEEKPIFLSIGYSTCHWCHVMERESFENQSVADFLNQHFVSIKVDREERPDVDRIYMTFVQAMTTQGGWPLNVFLFPDLRPFYGGTYWPPENKHGRPGFLQVLHQIHKAWEQRRQQLGTSALQLHQRLVQLTERRTASPLSPDISWLHQAAHTLKQGYDPVHGGFGEAPKFPSPSHPAFLLRYGVRFQDNEAVQMVFQTCERMAAGGICDQIGGGFARYSIDRQWLVPHFEKMLYDNAQLASLYLDAYLVSGDESFGDVARKTIDYVLREMTHPQGGFYSAEDADSEGKEGKFYCWTLQELSTLLTPAEYQVAVRYFGLTETGNFVDHSDPNPLPHQNVLSIAEPKLGAAEHEQLAAAKEKMFQARSLRVRPQRDDKILASWNGLMLGALARAAAVLQNPSYRAAAEKNLAFLQRHLWDPDSRALSHRWREGERDSVQLLESYAFLLAGVIELYQTTLLPKHLRFAIDLAEAMLRRFYDAAEGGFWQAGVESTDLILRLKEDYDGAEPSGNSAAMLALLKLAAITGRADFRQAVDKTLALFADRLQQMPQTVPYMLLVLDFCSVEPHRAVLAGDPTHPDAQQLIHHLHRVYQPNKVVLGTGSDVDSLAQSLQTVHGQPVVYLCSGTACHPSSRDPHHLQNLLRQL